MMNPTKLLACIVATLLLQSQAHAAGTSVYKWKDKDGVIHYSQTAPQGQEVEVLTTKTPRAPLPTETVNTPSATANTGSATSSATPADPNAKKTDEAPVAKKDQAVCDKATKAIEDLQKPIIMSEGKIMSIEEKNAQIKRMQEIAEVHCP